jgi:arylsulfatase A
LAASQAQHPIGLPVRRRLNTRPNIVLIYCDDLGYGDPGCYGSEIPTPGIDALASEGIRFTSFASTSAVCSPARASLLTGRYPSRVGVTEVLQPTDTGGLSLSETTLADALRSAGYATMCVGKWHLGSQPQYMPTSRGFDGFYGLPYSNDMSPLPLYQNTTVIEQPANLATLTQRYTEQAVSFISRSKDTPFFLYMPHTFPHVPLAASPGFAGRSGFGPYGDTVAEIDWSVGQVLGALKSNGLDANTLVMFSSDHGPWFEGSNGNLHGRKGEIWEGGMRVPFLARFPGRIPAGLVCNGLATTLDVFPTVARLTNAPLPAATLDGVDIWPLLTGQTGDLPRETFLYFDSINLQAARQGAWKLHVARFNTPPWLPLPGGVRKNVRLLNPELYNLDSDPEEHYDRAGEHPAIVASILADMERLAAGFPGAIPTLWREMMSTQGIFCFSGGWPAAPQG